MAMTKTVLFLGYGYSARALAPQLVDDGWRAIGTTRDPAKAEEMGNDGVESVILPDPNKLAGALGQATHIVISAAPGEKGDPFIGELPPITPEWVGYLSTTAVYGDHGGAWVDEDTPVSPNSDRAKYRVLAEQQWLASGLPVHIFRLAGIYGPGRGPFAKLRNGTARRIIKPGQMFSRIHVDDIAAILRASIAQPNPGAIYNLCDDDPAPPQDVLAYAAGLIGLPVPPAEDFETADMRPMARSFYLDNKRVRNDRIKTELGVRLIHPDYKSGLRALAGQ